MNPTLTHGASSHVLDKEGSLMTEKNFETQSASSFSVDKAARRTDDLLDASRLTPHWVRNWRTPEVLLRLLSPIALLL